MKSGIKVSPVSPFIVSFSGKIAERENKPGKSFSSFPITLSNVFCEVFGDAINDMSESVNVNDPLPNSTTASIDILTASAQSGVGTPKPISQLPGFNIPANFAAFRIFDSVFFVSAEQLSNLILLFSLLKRIVNGDITGLGADIFNVSFIPVGCFFNNIRSNFERSF